VVLPANRLLRLLPAADFKRIATHLKAFSAKAGVVLYEAGAPVDYVYFPHSGMISMLSVLADGKGIEVATVGNEGAVGALEAVGMTVSLTRGVVQIDIEASRIRRSDFKRCFTERLSVQKLVHRNNEGLLGQIQQTAACNSQHNVEQRLARWLLQVQDRVPNKPMDLTQEFLSEMLGVQRTSVTAIAGVLQDKGLIKYRRGSIEILDRAGLEAKACECYGAVALHSRQLLAKSFA
jgi:CRP-like cAMP-binding protein